jgi:hypothetical protein
VVLEMTWDLRLLNFTSFVDATSLWEIEISIDSKEVSLLKLDAESVIRECLDTDLRWQSNASILRLMNVWNTSQNLRLIAVNELLVGCPSKIVSRVAPSNPNCKINKILETVLTETITEYLNDFYLFKLL